MSGSILIGPRGGVHPADASMRLVSATAVERIEKRQRGGMQLVGFALCAFGIARASYKIGIPQLGTFA
jgi:hypothetical protein